MTTPNDNTPLLEILLGTNQDSNPMADCSNQRDVGSKDRLVVSGVVLGLMILPAVGVKLFSISQAYQRAVEKRVHRWEVKYDLDQSQVEELIAVETEFHHYQKPFSFQKEPTKEDEEAHRSELAEILKQQVEVPNH